GDFVLLLLLLLWGDEREGDRSDGEEEVVLLLLRPSWLCSSPGRSQVLQSKNGARVRPSTNRGRGGSPCSCRRSRRLLTNGYYVLGEDSISWDQDGNMSLTPSKTNVSYKENPVRLLSGVTETCQTWLDEKVFGGVFSSPAPAATPASSADAPEPTWMDPSTPEPESSFSFTYDHSEIISPPEKEAPPPQTLFREEICTETCHSQEQFTQSLGGLPLLWAGAAVLITTTASMVFTKVGPVGRWRRDKTEDITSKNE
ncbi:hypothetical protein CRUP_026917, partial [Coryphaenoides rupestris]